MESAEPELVRLAIGIAEYVLHQPIALDRDVVVKMANVAIGRLVEKESITVRVNPGDFERMKEHRDELLDSGELKNFRVVEGQRIDCCGVLVETDGGTLSTYREAADLINIGAYVAGSNPRVDLAISRQEAIKSFMRQGIYETSTFEEAQRGVMALG